MQLLRHVHLLASGAMGFDWTDPADCNVYLLDGGGELGIVDTGTGDSAGRIIEHLKASGFGPRQVRCILLTHLHADHAGGAAALRERTGAQVAAAAEAKSILETGDEEAIDLVKARAMGFYRSDYRFAPCPLDRPLRDGDTFNVGSLQVRARLLPGHSRLDTFYLVRDGGGHVSLFSGDAFFFGGRISLLNTHDFDLKGLARAAGELAGERVDSLFPGHLQPALGNGARHIRKAAETFARLMVPPSIV